MESILKQKKVVGLFAVIGIIGGIFFTGTEITGNVILTENTKINLIPIVGILLLVCSAILLTYILKKKE
jgi:Mg2+ and Co2+ transporter CorA